MTGFQSTGLINAIDKKKTKSITEGNNPRIVNDFLTVPSCMIGGLASRQNQYRSAIAISTSHGKRLE